MELKPCPFCGGEAVRLLHENGMEKRVAICCGKCGAQTTAFICIYEQMRDGFERAAEKWNRRAEQ